MRKATYKQIKMEVNNDIYEGKSIEREMEQAETSQVPIKSVSPIIYTERKDGVLPQYDIRTDRFEIAQEAMGKIAASIQAKRMETITKQSNESSTNNSNGETTTAPTSAATE